jgi:hypothetical protein
MCNPKWKRLLFLTDFEEKYCQKMLFSLSVSVAFAEYTVATEYSAEYTANTFGRNHLRSDTKSSCTLNFDTLAQSSILVSIDAKNATKTCLATKSDKFRHRTA